MKLNKFCKIEKYIDFYKILLGIIIIVFFAVSPIILAMVGVYIEGFIIGMPVSDLNEGNSHIMAIGWLGLITVPSGFIVLIIWLIISTISIISFFQRKKVPKEN
jgi:hypothetical protein